MQAIVEYLLDRVSGGGKARGVKFLKDFAPWEDNMELYVSKALDVLQLNFRTDKANSPIGSANLTNVSSKIGESIGRTIRNEAYYWDQTVTLGDLFVEAFLNCKYIEIYFFRDSKESRYIIEATDRWVELGELPESLNRARLAYTVTELPDLIKGPMQNIKGVPYPIVKGQNDKSELEMDTPFIRALNKCQRTGWRINERILDAIVNQCEPSMIPENDKDKELRRRSKVVSWRFNIRKAQSLRHESVFYQYLDADYRGRIYYKEAFFTYQGADEARGLMQFAKSKPMTEAGKYWLAIHTASSYNMSYKIDEIPEWCEEDYKTHLENEGLDNISVDKMKLNDRVEWTNQYMESILKAGRTLEVVHEAEKKITFLACCLEWSDIEINGVNHRTRLPIPIDGSNNGWQHLGAISRDPQTGVLVGLVPVDIQKDFYVATAAEMIRLTTDPRLVSILEKMPMKAIRKGISKRGSMTKAYSAGPAKIAENMFADCKVEDYHEKYGITQDDCSKLAKILCKAISNVCPGPLETMKFFQDLAKYELGESEWRNEDGLEAKAERQALIKEQQELYRKEDKTEEEEERCNELLDMIKTYEYVLVKGNNRERIYWRSPSGFEVEYKCYKTRKERCKGTIRGFKNGNKQEGRVNHVAQVVTDYPDSRGFICGISPNIIHSYDAAHMSLVIDDWDGTFGAVHDSFSTHACDVDNLLELTKKKFIDMYAYDNFYNHITNEILFRNGEDKPFLGDIPTQPTRGSLDIEEVINSDYFFA